MRQIDFTNTQDASSETARDINRGVVLNLIRRRQPISRADLARLSGLQRSTISLITEQLIREKWVIYGPVGRLPRGRHVKSHFGEVCHAARRTEVANHLPCFAPCTRPA